MIIGGEMIILPGFYIKNLLGENTQKFKNKIYTFNLLLIIFVMANTFSQIYIQYVFTVKGRENLLLKSWRDELFKYMSGIIKLQDQKSIIVNGVDDHVHALVGLKPIMRISDLVRDIKNNSSNFINENKFLKHPFSWQEGYGVFSYSHREIKNVYEYIFNQEEHHKKMTFESEYLDFLQEFEIEHDEKYLFDWIK